MAEGCIFGSFSFRESVGARRAHLRFRARNLVENREIRCPSPRTVWYLEPVVTQRAFAGRIIAPILFAFFVAASIRTFPLVMFFTDRTELRAVYSSLFDRGVTQYPPFLREVAARTRPGDSIAIFVPMRRWDDGYAYAYYRAHWFLAGRNVLPLVWRDDRILGENFHRAEYVASWRMKLDRPDLVAVGEFHGGTLYARRKLQ